MTNARIERMLRELHAGPPLRFMEDVFSLREIVKEQVASINEASKAESPVLALR